MAAKTALINNIESQYGCFLVNKLLKEDYKVIGISNEYFKNNFNNTKIEMHDINNITNLVRKYKPDEFYNFDIEDNDNILSNTPILFAKNAIFDLIRILEAIRNYSPETEIFVSDCKIDNISQRNHLECLNLTNHNMIRCYGNKYKLNVTTIKKQKLEEQLL